MYKREGKSILNSDLVKSICSIFLHDGQSVTPDHAAELLGWSLDEMDKAIKWGDIELDPTAEDTRISRAEMIEKATHQWPFSVIQEALGPNVVTVSPARRWRASKLSDPPLLGKPTRLVQPTGLSAAFAAA